MSSQVTSGVVAKPSLRTLGCTFLMAASKSCCVMAHGVSCAGVRGPAWSAAAAVPSADAVVGSGIAVSVLHKCSGLRSQVAASGMVNAALLN